MGPESREALAQPLGAVTIGAMHRIPSEPPGGDLAEALRERLEREADVLVAYLFGPRGLGLAGIGEAAEMGVAVLLDRDPDDEGRGLELRAAVEELAGRRSAEVLVLNAASAQAAYGALTDGRLLLCRDERAWSHHQLETVERYFELGALRRMLANGLRHRLDSGGLGLP